MRQKRAKEQLSTAPVAAMRAMGEMCVMCDKALCVERVQCVRRALCNTISSSRCSDVSQSMTSGDALSHVSSACPMRYVQLYIADCLRIRNSTTIIMPSTTPLSNRTQTSLVSKSASSRFVAEDVLRVLYSVTREQDW